MHNAFRKYDSCIWFRTSWFMENQRLHFCISCIFLNHVLYAYNQVIHWKSIYLNWLHNTLDKKSLKYDIICLIHVYTFFVHILILSINAIHSRFRKYYIKMISKFLHLIIYKFCKTGYFLKPAPNTIQYNNNNNILNIVYVCLLDVSPYYMIKCIMNWYIAIQ